MENLIYVDSSSSFLFFFFLLLVSLSYFTHFIQVIETSQRSMYVYVYVCMHSINNISLYFRLYFSFSYVPFESTVDANLHYYTQLELFFLSSLFSFSFFLIQRPIDTYCNRFVVGRRHSFSLPSKQQNRIE
jgi:hypothetical protein